MIDINELRRKANSTDIVDHIDLHANIRPIISELLDRLEAAEKETASWKGLAKQFGNEADALRAKIEQMEKQRPVGVVQWINGWPVVNAHDGVLLEPNKPLYALPGAQSGATDEAHNE